MRLWREIVGDWWSGGTLCVLLALTFALQILVVGQAAAAMTAPVDAAVICSSSPDAEHAPAVPGHRHECPCAELCGSGAQMPASATPADRTGILIRFAERIEIAVDRSAESPWKPVVRQRAARGPPQPSIRD